MSDQPDLVDNPADSRFEIHLDGVVAGFAEYQRRDGALALTHTVVEDAFEGRGLGSALAAGALDAARKRGEQVLPVCPFIRSYIERHPAYLELVPVGRRDEFRLSGAGPGSEIA